MKQINIRWMTGAALALGLGFGASVSAFDSDPLCYSSCQEQLNDCRAQSQDPQWNSQHCNPIYRECIAACGQ